MSGEIEALEDKINADKINTSDLVWFGSYSKSSYCYWDWTTLPHFSKLAEPVSVNPANYLTLRNYSEMNILSTLRYFLGKNNNLAKCFAFRHHSEKVAIQQTVWQWDLI